MRGSVGKDVDDSSSAAAVDVSVIIISWNTREILRKCIRDVPAGFEEMSLEVIVVDNGSSDGTQEMVRTEFSEVVLVENKKNLGFPKAVNQGIEVSRGKYVAILNSDTMVTPGSLEALAVYLEKNPNVAATGPQLMSRDGHYQYSGGHAPSLYAAFNELAGVSLLLGKRARKLFVRSRSAKGAMDVDWLCAACMIVRREAIEDAGMFDDDHFMYAEDMEYGLRLRAHGWGVHFLPGIFVIHYGGASSAGLPQTKLLWLGGLFRVAADNLSRATYPIFGIFLSIAYLQRSLLIRAVRVMPGLNHKGFAHAREAAAYARTAFMLGFHDPDYASEFCRDLEEQFRNSQRT